MEIKTQTQPCVQNQLDLKELADRVREKLRQGVELFDGGVVMVNLSVYHFTYVKIRENRAKVVYVTGCIGTHVDTIVNSNDVEIKDVKLYNLCNDKYDI